MNEINSIEQILPLINSVKKESKKFFTNFFYDPKKLNLWIKKRILFYTNIDNSVVFIKKNKSFLNFFLCVNNSDELKDLLLKIRYRYTDVKLVTDIVEQEPRLGLVSDILEKAGFHKYTSLVRMSRLINNTNEDSFVPNVNYANINNLMQLNNLLNTYFDELAEQLPLIEELEEFIHSNKVLIVSENSEILGFVIFDIIGVTSYLRYWFVHPNHRNKKVGSTLLRKFFNESSNTKRQLFWVIEENENAIKRYKHYGFIPEALKDVVFINQNIKYESRYN
jgi:ribosomal protein S18 acetylase RimI-like enzyme